MTDAALLEALVTGGPTAALVLMVGWFTRGWATRVDESLKECKKTLDKLGKAVVALETKVGD